ncbi:MAG: methyltransferase domain-containing protein [Actinomycetia bacterium]|nr:methyltransferase domain-containing protein [Actinomycetes bacterium]
MGLGLKHIYNGHGYRGFRLNEVEQALKSQKKYNRNARFYDFVEFPLEYLFYSRLRKKYFSALTGKILDVGIGTGKNINYYHPDAEVTGIDFSAGMLDRARKKLAGSNRRNIVLAEMDVENLAFESKSFDYVITSTVFCSVPHPVKGLKEIQRVLKPEGRAVMIEHVRSKGRLASFLQDLLNPITRLLTGININRDTGQNIKKVGMVIVREENLALGDVFKLFIAKNGQAY